MRALGFKACVLAAAAVAGVMGGAARAKAASIGAVLTASRTSLNEGGSTTFGVALTPNADPSFHFVSWNSASATVTSGSAESSVASVSSTPAVSGNTTNPLTFSVGSITYYQNGSFTANASGSAGFKQKHGNDPSVSVSANFTASIPISVANVPASLTIDALAFDFFLTAGDTGYYSINFTDPGHDAHKVEWDFGYNGVTFNADATQTTILSAGALGNTAGSASASHQFLTSGSYEGAVRIWDGNDYTLSTFSINVNRIGTPADTAAVPTPASALAGLGLLGGLGVKRLVRSRRDRSECGPDAL